MISKIVSGGQTGVDRAALDTAIALGFDCGGWCPAGRRAEDGPIDAAYPLTETPVPNYAVRTKWNVRDSDGTLVLSTLPLTGGTLLTEREAARCNRPCLVVDLFDDTGFDEALIEAERWIAQNRIEILNVAVPRESSRPGIGAKAALFLRALLAGSIR